MSEKIKIQMFGHKDGIVPASRGWGSRTRCGSGGNPITFKMYEELKAFLEDTDVKDKIEIEFIDIDKDDLSKYPKEGKLLNRGFKLPITFISGEPIFSGQVDRRRAYLILKKMWCSSTRI